MEEVRRYHPPALFESGAASGWLGLGLFLGLGAVLTLWGQSFFFGRIHPFFSTMILMLFAVGGLASLGLAVRAVGGQRDLFAQGQDYLEALLQSSKDMVSLEDRQILSEKVIKTLTEILNVQSAIFFLFDAEKNVYRLRVSVGWGKEFKHISLPPDDPLIGWLSNERRILTEQEIAASVSEPERPFLVKAMRLLSAKIILPLVVQDQLVGFCSLGAKTGGREFTPEEMELLSILGNQASAALENSRLYESWKSSQQMLQRTDRLSSLGLLTAGLAHEIRNPLVAIRTFSQLLPERYQDQEFIEGFYNIAVKEVDRICGLIDNLLSFARPAPPQVSEQDINEILESTIRILESKAKEKNLQIQRRFAPDLAKIYVDKERMRQVSMNVILNAIQAMRGPGTIEVATRPFTRNGVGHFVQIEVRDSGPGIPEKELETIFNPFFTTKKDGCGLGLFITRQIVQEHGGYIVVESREGQGTALLIHLPADKINATATKPRPEVHEKDSGC